MKKPIVRTHREPFSRSFGTNETQQLLEGQLVGQTLLQRLATGATGVKQARYRRGPTRGSDALYAHAQYNTQPVGIEGPWHLLFNAWCNEFRRGFCTLVSFDIGAEVDRTQYYIIIRRIIDESATLPP